jgi:hypothetical protein
MARVRPVRTRAVASRPVRSARPSSPSYSESKRVPPVPQRQSPSLRTSSSVPSSYSMTSCAVSRGRSRQGAVDQSQTSGLCRSKNPRPSSTASTRCPWSSGFCGADQARETSPVTSWLSVRATRVWSARPGPSTPPWASRPLIQLCAVPSPLRCQVARRTGPASVTSRRNRGATWGSATSSAAWIQGADQRAGKGIGDMSGLLGLGSSLAGAARGCAVPRSVRLGFLR